MGNEMTTEQQIEYLSSAISYLYYRCGLVMPSPAQLKAIIDSTAPREAGTGSSVPLGGSSFI